MKAEYRLLDLSRMDDAIPLYRSMVRENAPADERLGRLSTDDSSLRDLLRFSLDPEEDLFFLAYEKDRAIGFVDCSRIHREGGKPAWFVKSIFMEEAFRGADAFASLMGKLEDSVRERGGRELVSSALPGDPVAEALWAGIGYAREGGVRIKRLS